MKVMQGLLYTEDHEWVRLDGKNAYIGIADFAQNQLGDIVYVELPEVDDEIEKGEDFGAVESVKAASDIYMPVSGRVIEVNEDLMDDSGLLNTDPYENWIIKVELTDESELEELMSHTDYEKFLAEEV